MDDDCDPEADAWYLATEIGVGVDPDTDRAALDELADAMLVRRRGPEFERLTDEAVAQLWDDELAGWIREGLERLSRRETWERTAAAALAEFDRDPPAATVSREVIRHLAMQLGGEDTPFLFCFDCLDTAVSAAPSEGRRALALEVAVVAIRNVGASEAEVHEALRSPAGLARLGSPARRAAVRARLGRLGSLGRDSLPSLAAELRSIAAEPPPPRAADDDVWAVVSARLVAEAARPGLN